MTWTVTALGVASGAAATSITLTGLTLSVNDGIAVFVQYTDFGTDAITVTDNASPPNTYTGPVDNLADGTSGQCQASFYCASCTHTATSITASFGSPVVQSFTVLKFTNSVAGTPTLDGHSGLDNAPGTFTPNSGAGTATSGDLVLSGITGNGFGAFGGTPSSIAMTGVTSPTLGNDDNTTGSADAYGVTTTTGNVTTTWTLLNNPTSCVTEMIFRPPSAAASSSAGYLFFGQALAAKLGLDLVRRDFSSIRRLLLRKDDK